MVALCYGMSTIRVYLISTKTPSTQGKVQAYREREGGCGRTNCLPPKSHALEEGATTQFGNLKNVPTSPRFPLFLRGRQHVPSAVMDQSAVAARMRRGATLIRHLQLQHGPILCPTPFVESFGSSFLNALQYCIVGVGVKLLFLPSPHLSRHSGGCHRGIDAIQRRSGKAQGQKIDRRLST